MTPLPSAFRALRLAAVAASCALLGQAATAQGGETAGAPAASTFRVNGFGTLAAVGVSSGDDWGFQREATQRERTGNAVSLAPDSRFGLQANWAPDAQWELVGQLVLKPRPRNATAVDSLAWAFAAWHPSPDWTIRAGRTSPDLFLLADVRNVGFAYPWIRPSVEFYGWMPLSALDGLDATRQFQVGDTRWRAKLFAGRSPFALTSTHGTDQRGVTNPLMGGTLTGEAGRLMVKATFAEARSRAASARAIDQLHGALDTLATLPVPAIAAEAAALRDTFPVGTLITRYSALAVGWDASPWQVQAELSRITGNFIASQAWYGYASAAYRIGNVTPFALVGRSRSSRAPLAVPDWTATLAPLLGPQNAALAERAGASVAATYDIGRIDQRSVGVGARWDVAAQVALKLQVDAVHSAAYGGGLWAYNGLAAHHAVVTSLGMDFVF